MTERDAILIVDDNERLVETLCAFAEERGYATRAAHTGREGLRALREEPVSLVLLDLVLPDMDGVTVMKEAQRIAPGTDIIMVTGHATLESAIAAVEAGAAGYVVKPLELSRLDALLARVLERRRLQRDNARLEREARERLREAEALLEVSGAVTGTLDLPEALRRLCRTLARLTGADTAAAYVHDRSTDLLLPTAGYRMPKENVGGRPIPLRSQGFFRPVWEFRRPVWSDNIPGDSRFGQGLFQAQQPRSGVLLPLLVGEEVAGAFYVVWWNERRALAERELTLLEHVSAQASLLLRNVRLFEQGEADRRRLATLNEVSRRLSAAHEATEILSLIVEEAPHLLGVEAAAIRLLEGDDLVLAAHTETAAALVTRQRIKVGESLSGRAVAKGEPVAVEDLGEDPRFDVTHRAGALALGFHGFLGVPMTARGRPIGALNVYSKARRRFSAEDIRLLSAFADHASLAIEKARLHAETRAQQTRLAQILESTSDGVMLVGREGQIEAANRRAGDLLGFEPGEVVGVALGELLTGYRSTLRGWDEARASLLALLDSPEPGGDGDLELSRQQRVVHWAARPTRDAEGRTVGFTLTFQDVTQEREVSRMKSDFVSFVTHQLRTPLAGIRWLLELARGEPGLPAEAGSLLRDAEDANRRLISLVNDLLDISRLESGKLTVALGPVDLAELTRSVLDDLAPLVQERGHRVAVEAPDGCPAALADPTLMRQVVLNLLSNAVKYTPAGGAIDICVQRAGESLFWAVRDTGIGIPPEGQGRLFEKFYRADNALTLETEGTGLGLYLVRLIVERLGGRVGCESEVGAGATFKLTLPVSQ